MKRLLLLLALLPSLASAATNYWIGTNNANYNVPGNWSLGSVPSGGAGDVASFHATAGSNTSCTVNTGIDVYSLVLEGSYTGTVNFTNLVHTFSNQLKVTTGKISATQGGRFVIYGANAGTLACQITPASVYSVFSGGTVIVLTNSAGFYAARPGAPSQTFERLEFYGTNSVINCAYSGSLNATNVFFSGKLTTAGSGLALYLDPASTGTLSGAAAFYGPNLSSTSTQRFSYTMSLAGTFYSAWVFDSQTNTLAYITLAGMLLLTNSAVTFNTFEFGGSATLIASNSSIYSSYFWNNNNTSSASNTLQFVDTTTYTSYWHMPKATNSVYSFTSTTNHIATDNQPFAPAGTVLAFNQSLFVCSNVGTLNLSALRGDRIDILLAGGVGTLSAASSVGALTTVASASLFTKGITFTARSITSAGTIAGDASTIGLTGPWLASGVFSQMTSTVVSRGASISNVPTFYNLSLDTGGTTNTILTSAAVQRQFVAVGSASNRVVASVSGVLNIQSNAQNYVAFTDWTGGSVSNKPVSGYSVWSSNSATGIRQPGRYQTGGL